MMFIPVPSLSADGTQPLDVGPGGGGAAGLAQLLHQHVDQLDVEGLVIDLELVPQADNGTLPDSQPEGHQLWRQSLYQVGVKLNKESSKPGQQISQDVQSFQLNTIQLLS